MWSKNYRSLAVKVRNGGRRIQCTMLKLGIRVDFLKVFTLQRTVVSRRLSLGLPVWRIARFLIEYFFSSCLYWLCCMLFVVKMAYREQFTFAAR